MTRAILELQAGGARRRVDLAGYLDGDLEERAAADACSWIKSVRRAHVEGVPLRRRFSYRGDSLWWFAELYLHKQQVVLDVHRTIAALDALLGRERPAGFSVSEGSALVRLVAARFAAARGVQFSGSVGRRPALAALAAMDARGSWLQGAALASRVRRRLPPGGHRATVLAFVHRAFLRSDAEDGSAEQYIGPVLEKLHDRLPGDGLQCVSVGPAANFRARRWWHPVLRSTGAPAARPIEAFASFDALASSSRFWRARHILRRALWSSDELRSSAGYKAATAGRSYATSSRASRCCSGRGRRVPWTRRALRSTRSAVRRADLRGSGRLGPRHRARVAAPWHRHGRPAAWLHLQALAELPARAGRDVPRPGAPSDAGFPHPSVTLLFDGTRPGI